MSIKAGRERDAMFSASVADYFDGVAGLWSRNYSPQGAMLARVTRFSEALFAQGTDSGRLLDFGCGTGAIASAHAGLGFKVTGCDIARHMLDVARREHADSGVEWVQLPSGDTRLPFEDGSFDAVIASSVLEYVPEPAHVLREFHRILSPGGVVLCSLPDERHPVRKKEQEWLASAEQPVWRAILGCLPRSTPLRRRYDYLKLSVTRWPIEKWCSVFQEAGFEVADPSSCDDPLLILAGRKSGPSHA
ncbi:MAG: methyltransferase domain-containing protein [Rhodocyclaceae bacterium]